MSVPLFWAQNAEGVWMLTSEGARKAWETRRANGEGAKEPAAPAPRAASARPSPAGATPKRAVENIFSEIKRGVRKDDISAVEPTYDGKGAEFSVRYLGDWQNPPDAEDEEDYDHQEPTPATARKFDEIARKNSTPDVEVSWMNQEKNWVTFIARPRERR